MQFANRNCYRHINWKQGAVYSWMPFLCLPATKGLYTWGFGVCTIEESFQLLGAVFMYTLGLMDFGNLSNASLLCGEHWRFVCPPRWLCDSFEETRSTAYLESSSSSTKVWLVFSNLVQIWANVSLMICYRKINSAQSSIPYNLMFTLLIGTWQLLAAALEPFLPRPL